MKHQPWAEVGELQGRAFGELTLFWERQHCDSQLLLRRTNMPRLLVKWRTYCRGKGKTVSCFWGGMGETEDDFQKKERPKI